MISLDKIVLEFIQNNILTMGLALVFLNGLCEIIPGKIDDRIVAIFRRMVAFSKRQTTTKE